MPINLKVARTESEVDHALWVRHEVFVVEDGKFGGRPLHEERVVDRFDAFPSVHNIIVYDDGEPVATLRLTRDGSGGLPADEYFNFSGYRDQVAEEWRTQNRNQEVVLASGGMLAVRGKWRSRRDVIRAMFKIAAGVFRSWGATHIVATVNHETASMYKRLGFTPLRKKLWVEEVGNFVVPLAALAEEYFRWAFGDIPKTPLDTFKDSFERLFLRPGEVVFAENDNGEHAYIIDTGTVRISRRTPKEHELTLSHLTRGDLFGELALVDRSPRSATATAITGAELMSLARGPFLGELYNNPRRVHQLLEVFSARLRRMDDFAMVLAFSSEQQRLEFALRMIKANATPDPRKPGTSVFDGGAEELATSAATNQESVRTFLAERQTRGDLEFSKNRIRFLR